VELKLNDFLMVNGLIVTVIVLSFFLIRRSPRAPVKLDLRSSDVQPKTVGSRPAPRPHAAKVHKPTSHSTHAPHKGARTQPGWENYRPRQNYSESAQWVDSPTFEKNLNVFFNWNGHSWDAYEALGLPAGSSREAVTRAFVEAERTSDPEALPFLRAAFDAILRS
jgi:hypothetical protein